MSTRPIRTMRILSSRQRRSKKRTLYVRQEGRCALCAMLSSSRDLILKHRVHRKKGGMSDYDNLYLICHHCHRRGARQSKED